MKKTAAKEERWIRNKDPNNGKEAQQQERSPHQRGRGRWLTKGDEQQRSIQNSRGSGKAVQEGLEAEEKIIRERQQ